MMTPEQIAEMLAQANAQSGVIPTTTTPTVTNTVATIKEGEIIEPKVPEYRTPEELRLEAEQLALETEKLNEITALNARLIEDLTLTQEDKDVIIAKLKELDPEAVEATPQNETPEQEIARLKKELEDAKKAKEEVKDPLAVVEAKAKEQGVDVPELYKEYVENGELSEASLKSLLDAGFDKRAVDAYIDTKIASAEAEATKIITETVGTRDNYDAMATWMRDNLKPDEIAKYDAGVNTEHAKIYIENMYSKYTKATVAPTIIRNNGSANSGQGKPLGFNSINEQNLALADSRYGRDTKYTNEVRTKMLHSTNLS